MYHYSLSEGLVTTISQNDENDLIDLFKLMSSVDTTKINVKDLRNRFISHGVAVSDNEVLYILKVCICSNYATAWGWCVFMFRLNIVRHCS